MSRYVSSGGKHNAIVHTCVASYHLYEAIHRTDKCNNGAPERTNLNCEDVQRHGVVKVDEECLPL